MERAIALSLENVRTARGGPFAALVVRNESVIGEGVPRAARVEAGKQNKFLVLIGAHRSDLLRFAQIWFG